MVSVEPTPAAARAHVRFRLAVGGMADACPSCSAPPGLPCERNPHAGLSDRDWRPDPRPYAGHPVVCESRAHRPGSIGRTAIENALALCASDDAFDAFHADLEPMRLAHFPDVTTPTPTRIGVPDAG